MHTKILIHVALILGLSLGFGMFAVRIVIQQGEGLG